MYGEIEMHPKHHYMLHLPQMLWQHGVLIACFVHEWKHKEIKRYANELDYTAGDWEFSVLNNVFRVQCECIFEEPCLSYDRVCHKTKGCKSSGAAMLARCS